MENDIKKPDTERKTTCIFLLIFSLVFIAYYVVMSMMSPGKKLSDIKNEFGGQQTKGNIVDEKLFTDSAYLHLLKEKAFLQSRISMAETDSIYLTINLTDSTTNLELSGVVVHSSKMKKMRISKILRAGNEYVISSMFSTPLSISDDYATIKKEPLMIKMAPKDTSEYKPDIVPDTSDYEPVNYILEMDKGIKIYVYQEEKTKFGDRFRFLLFDFNDRMRNTWRSFKSIIRFKIPEYHPFIKIRLPKAEAKILYRAIPRKGQIAVYR